MDNLDKNNQEPIELDDDSLGAAAGGAVDFPTKYTTGDYIRFSPKYCSWCKTNHTVGFVSMVYGTSDQYCYVVRTICGHLTNVYPEDI